MKEKIIAFVFGLLAFVIELAISVRNPSVGSVVAAVFALVIVIDMLILIRKENSEKSRIVFIEDQESKGKRDIDNALKLANEIKPYIRKKDGRIYLRIYNGE